MNAFLDARVFQVLHLAIPTHLSGSVLVYFHRLNCLIFVAVGCCVDWRFVFCLMKFFVIRDAKWLFDVDDHLLQSQDRRFCLGCIRK